MGESFLISEMRILHCDRTKVQPDDCDEVRSGEFNPKTDYFFFEILIDRSKKLFAMSDEHFDILINLECSLRKAIRIT